VNRFDSDTRAAFLDLYTKIDADAEIEDAAELPEEIIQWEES
jgi:hypothetical protein